ncbi:MAG: nucleotide exchange factor GrpE [Patescibacteria group bacterium]|nr:nucleotide exchange factor GrpE [Patescibacteria group bacterium]
MPEEKDKNKKEIEQTEKADLEKELESIKEKLGECEKLKEEYLNGWQRERANFLNYQKEINKKMEEIVRFANEELIIELLNVLDSFDISINSLNIEGLTENEQKIVRGLELIQAQLLNILKLKGLEQISVKPGDDFNPTIHEAMEIVNGEEDGKIAEEIIKGYKLNGKLIRPAKVKIFKKVSN